MMLLFAFALYSLLLHRLGFFPPVAEFREAQAFDALLLEVGETEEWETRMQQLSRRIHGGQRTPSLQFKLGK